MDVVVTGASRGIGLELTAQALARGYRVLAVARSPENSEGLQKLKTANQDLLEIAQIDVGRPEAGDQVALAIKQWPKVDILINNAGINQGGEAWEDFRASFEVNSIAPFFITRALLSKLKESNQPKCVQITSQLGSIANSSGGKYAYRASKTALNMISKSLALDEPWLTFLLVHPGWVQTDMGGKGAPVPIRESASGIWQVIDRADRNASGRFLTFKGESLPW